MVISYILEKKDLKAYAAYTQKHLPSIKRVRYVVVLFFVALSAHSTSAIEETWIFRAIYFLFIFGLFLAFYWCLGKVLTWIMQAVAFRSDQQQGVLCEHTVTLAEDAFMEVTPVNEGKHLWSGIHSVVNAPEHLFIFINGATAHVIPKRAFPDKQTERDFYERAVQLHDQAQKAGKTNQSPIALG